MAKAPQKDPVLLEFGQRIRIARLARGWTQEGLGEHAGMDRTYIGGIERGERNLTLVRVNRLALVLGESAVGFMPCRPRPTRR